MQTLRTPDSRFTYLPEFPYEPTYSDIPDGDGGTVRVAWPADGPQAADPVLMLHGEPSWSYLYRKMIPVLLQNVHLASPSSASAQQFALMSKLAVVRLLGSAVVAPSAVPVIRKVVPIMLA